ncbi:MAG: TetR/AcrR family transcriptional regulator [Magnetococcales bacterium]|nr:TetR/AcrR family transcriptional regulator [Magnetococcales bacterium]
MILSAAERLVASEGPRALTARKIAELIGYSPGTLYNLFANLDDLVLHLNAQTLESLDKKLQESPFAQDPVADLMALAEAYLAFQDAHPHLWNLLFEYRLSPEISIPDWYLKRIRTLFAHAERALAPLFWEDDLRHRSEAAQVLWASLHGISQLASAGKLELISSHSALNLARILITNFVRGIRVNEVSIQDPDEDSCTQLGNRKIHGV